MAIRLKPTDLVVHGNRLLRLYSYYSLFLALLLLIGNTLDKQNSIVGGSNPSVFLTGATIYVIVAAVFAAVANRQPDPQVAISYVFLEIAILSALMYASGGLESGFSSLILIPVAVSNLLAPGVLGFGVAAWTTLSVFYTQNYWAEGELTYDLINSGLYGLLCFVIAGITQTLSRRLKSALSLATDQATRLRRLQHFSRQGLSVVIGAQYQMDKWRFEGQALFPMATTVNRGTKGGTNLNEDLFEQRGLPKSGKG